MMIGMSLSLGAMRASAAYSSASMFAGGEAGDAWISNREWCYTKTLGGVYENVTTSGDLVARSTGMANGINSDQDDVPKRPAYMEGGGLSWLAYDGVDDALQTPSIDFTGTDKMSVFAGVHRVDATTRMVAELSPSPSSPGMFYFISGTDIGFTAYSSLSRGTINPGAAGGSGFSAASPSTDVVSITHDISGDLSTMRVNQVTGTSGTGDKGTGNFGNYPLNIGARNGSSIFFNGKLYGLIVRGAASTSPEILAAEAYLASLSGVTL